MTLNAIRTACNQTSSRDPVVDYDERTVNEILKQLRDADLVTTTWAGSGQRNVKFAQTIAARQGWSAAHRALLTVLLLRGPQPAGALRTRTERLHSFADRAQTEQALRELASADPPLVRELPKQPGQQDPRWVHLLGEVPAADDRHPAVTPVDLETPLADGPQIRDDRIRDSYGAIAEDYADAFTGELPDMPFERWLLQRLVDLADGPIVDAGCGPGHLTDHLARLGAEAVGIDLTPQMVEQASRRFPDRTYRVDDLRRLLRPDGADGWGAVLAWYSLIHLTGSELPAAVQALARPLRPGGWLLIALHSGAEVIRHPQWFGHPITLDFVLHPPESVVAAARAAGLVDIEYYLRGPQRDETTTRFHLLARRPD